MSTNAYVYVKQQDQSYIGIYVHWDGGLWERGVGYYLQKLYNSFDKANALVALGDMSSIDEHIELNDGIPVERVCIAYHRDRGEEFNRHIIDSRNEIEKDEFTYIFDGSWVVCLNGEEVSLEKALKDYKES